jgi:cell division protein FtsN
MADDEFDLEDPVSGDDTEADLDDFFQPTDASDGAEDKGTSVDDFFSAPDEGGGLDAATEKLPVDPARAAADPVDLFGDAEPVGLQEAEPESRDSIKPLDEGVAGGSEKSFFARNLILLIILALVVLLGGSGGFLFYSLVLKKPGVKTVAAKDTKKSGVKARPSGKKAGDKTDASKKGDKTAAPAAGKKTGGDKAIKAAKADKAGSDKKAAKPDQKVDDKKADASKKTPDKKTKAKTDKKPKTTKKKAGDATVAAAAPASAKKGEQAAGRKPVPSTGGPYTVQVGSYMLKASKSDPEKSLVRLGYSKDFRYVPDYRRVKIYHVIVGENLSRDEAMQIKSKIQDMNYAAPELMPEGTGYRVKVYSYGKMSVARSTKNKLAKSGIRNIQIKSETKEVTLDQLRVGSYATMADAKKAQRDLKRGGFKEAIIVKE